MVLDDICDLLSSGGVGVEGSTLFKSYLPEKPDAALVLYEYGGSEPASAMSPGAGTVAAEYCSVQVVCRAGVYDYASARAQAHRAFKLLEGLVERRINGVRYLYASAKQSPFMMGRDEASRQLVACNYEVVKELSSTS